MILRASSRRLAVVASILLYLALGLPVWWLTTRIQRPLLPHARMQQAPAQVTGFQLPVTITLYIQSQEQGLDLARVAEHLGMSLLKHSQDPMEDLTVHVIALSIDGRHCTRTSLQLPLPADGADGTSTAGASQVRSVALCQGPQFQALLASLGDYTPSSQLDDSWHSLVQQHGLSEPGSYHVVAAEAAADTEGQRPAVQLLVGQHRGALLRMPGREGGRPRQQQLLHALTAASPALARAYLPSSGSITAGQQPLSAAGEALLSFSLCNADPQGHYSTWGDFPAFQRRYLDPFIAALRPAVQLSVESHVLLYASSNQKGSWSDEHKAFVVKQGRLRQFVDSSWNLNTGAMAMAAAEEAPNATADEPPMAAKGVAAHSAESLIPKHVLHFVAYVPAQVQQPLLLLLPDEQPSPTNSFHVPSWGGVHVVNPEPQAVPLADCESGVPGLCAAAAAAARPLGGDTMAAFARAVVSQLRALLGVTLREDLLQAQAGVAGPQLELHALPALRAGVGLWEADVLLRQRAAHNAATAAQVLAGLSRLVEQLPTLEMPDLIGNQVEEALQALDQAVAAMHAGHHAAACTAAQAARSFAEAAFSNPAVLAQLSFPPSHLIGVYLPFFAPLAMALVQALVTEVGYFRKQKALCAG